ncbi:hypothetical protein MCG01_05105 [Enterococcus hirae]|nr:hypothetical protein [Enterococcus hirae]
MISSKKIVTLSAIAMIGVVFLAEPYMIAHAENTSNNQMQNCGQNFEQDYAALVQSGENLFSPNPSEGYAVSNFLGSATDTELINFERLLQIVNDESDTHNLDYNKIIYLNTLAPAAIKQALKTVVPVTDTQLSKNTRNKLGKAEDTIIQKSDMAKLTTTQNGLLTNVKDYTGLETAVNLEFLSTYQCGEITAPKLPNDLSQLTKLHMIGFSGNDGLTGTNDLTNGSIRPFATLPGKQIKTLVLANNHLTDLSPLDGKVTKDCKYNLSNQSLSEDKQVAKGNSVTVKVKDIKNIDGSMPEIIPNNGGVYDKVKGTITWTGLTKVTTSLSYGWKGKDTFIGTVSIPVEVKEEKVVNIPDSKLKTEINNELNREKINGKTNRASNENVHLAELSQVTKLDIRSKGINDLTGLECLGNKKVNWLALATNSLLDLSCLKEKVTDINPYLEKQKVTEEKQTVTGNTVTVKVKEIKNIDGSTPEITPSNGGVYDKEKGTITWNDLTIDTKNVSYSWKGNGAASKQHQFSGTVTVSVEVEDKVVNIPDSKLKTEINNELNREKINGKTNRASNENVHLAELSQVTKLDIRSKGINDLTGLECLGNKKVNWLALATNSLLDLSCLKEKVTDTNPYLENQKVTEKLQKIFGDRLLLKVKRIKNIDGSTPEIIPDNGGVYDKEKGTITWTALNKNTKNVSYSWKGNGATSEQHKFSGTITIPVEVTEDIPDNNLKKALNEKLGQAPDAQITVDQLATIKELDVNNKEIQSIDGLQYCVNLRKLKIGNDFMHVHETNTVSDLSPLKNLTRLTVLVAGNLKISDFSPLKSLPLNYCTDEDMSGTYLGTQTVEITLNTDKYSELNLKNPMIDSLGKAITPDSIPTDGAFNYQYDPTTNKFSLNYQPVYEDSKVKEEKLAFAGDNFKNVISYTKNTDLVHGRVALVVSTHVNSLFEQATNLVDQLFKNSDHTIIKDNVTQNDFLNIFSIVQELSEKYPTSGFLHKNEVLEFTKKLHDATQLFALQIIDFKGTEEYTTSPRVSLVVKDHKATVIKRSSCIFHGFSGNSWETRKYVSIKLTDPNGKVLYENSWRGNQAVEGNVGPIAECDLPEGSSVEVYHAEGPWHRFATSNDANLKTKLGKPGYYYAYKMQNDQLVLMSVK